MASQSKSRWGSLLQQAVAGVESRLDTILADGESPSIETTSQAGLLSEGLAEREHTPLAVPTISDVSRQSSVSKNNARLQERLAKVVVNRNNAKSAQSSAQPSRIGSPTASLGSLRESHENKAAVHPEIAQEPLDIQVNDQRGIISESFTNAGGEGTSNMAIPLPPSNIHPVMQAAQQRVSIDAENIDSACSPMENKQGISNGAAQPPREGQGTSLQANPTEHVQVIEQMRSDYEAAELHRQEEMHQYLENIDVLQAKLQYLTKEAAEFARRAASGARPGSAEDKLASKDKKIALLLEEGQKLSQTELKHMNTIRKLRAKSAEDEKRLVHSRHVAQDVEKNAKFFQELARQAEAAQREEQERVKELQKAEREYEKIKRESNLKESKIVELRSQLAELSESGAVDQAKEYRNLLEQERNLTSDLRDELTNAKIEKELNDERLNTQALELQERMRQEKERAKVADLELRGEIGVLESRLETFRAQAEEISSGNKGATQAKLLRQIETLQTQYSVASQNWRGIETSLLTRLSSLEKERDNMVSKEGDMRRKARESNTKVRRLEDSLDQATIRFQEMEDEISNQSTSLTSLKNALTKAEAAHSTALSDLIAERKSCEARLASLAAERMDSGLLAPENPYSQTHAESPMMSVHKKPNNGRASPHSGRRPQANFGLGLGTQLPFPEPPVARRASAQHSHGSITPYRYEYSPSWNQSPIITGPIETPSVHVELQDDMFDNVRTPATPERTINDMFSVSTTAAGPSIQLVERMSAAVRRLESEKAASKEEQSRLSAQRDEAREQVVVLMREVDAKREAVGRIATLETEVIEINQRYQTTLEMLGEKSELVDELRADVADVKQMYRDLVENTMN